VFVFKAAVVGAGTMGGEIAQAIANADIPVVLKDVEQRFVDRGMEKARSLWSELDSSELDRRLALITPATSYAEFGDVDFVVEAVPERMELKKAVLAQLDGVTPGHAILASNTSSLSITEMGLATTRPEQVVGLHFFYPASVNRLVEVIEGDDTSSETVQGAANFAQAIRKTPIRCADEPGFVVNRILTAAVSEVWRYQEQTGADTSELDTLVTEAKAAPIGPFALADVLGLDTVLYVTEYLQECYGDRFHVHHRMRELVAAGELGSKTGKGFYEHAG
jgi:3-hydroxyacyl-CoA dehydrogenase